MTRRITVECCEILDDAPLRVIGFEALSSSHAADRLTQKAPERIVYRIKPADESVVADSQRYHEDLAAVKMSGQTVTPIVVSSPPVSVDRRLIRRRVHR